MAVYAAPSLLVEPLKALCERCFAEHWTRHATLSGLPSASVGCVAELLALDLPLDLAVKEIPEEIYWRRRALFRWSPCEPPKQGRTWRELYCERHLAEVLEGSTSVSDVSDVLHLMESHVKSLGLLQLPSRLDLGLLFKGLCNLLHFTLQYNRSDLGTDFETSYFGIRMQECKSLAKALGGEFPARLQTLRLPGNMMNDKMVEVLAAGLAAGHSLTALDLSLNKVGDQGALALSKALAESRLVRSLNMSDNQIGPEGAAELALALSRARHLSALDMALNRIKDNGAQQVAEVLGTNMSLTRLNLRSCWLGQQAAGAFAALLSVDTVLRSLDLSINDLGEEGGDALLRAMECNRHILSLDLREAHIRPEALMALNKLQRQREASRKD